MPRSARLLLSKSYYHIITRGNNRNVVFKSQDDYYYYLKLLKDYKSVLPFNLYHYCLMPNHLHMLIQTNKASDFSLFMKKINLAYFHHFRQYYGWVGHFWQDRYKSQAVGKDSYFIQCGKYIELNPVRQNLVDKPEDYKYSSYRYYSHSQSNKLITEDINYGDLGNNNRDRQLEYQKIIIDDLIVENYPKPVWGSTDQQYNERNKRQKYFYRHR